MLVGYFAKEPLNRAEAEFLGPVRDIGSVAECIVSGAEDWYKHWKHNDFWRFDSEQLALSVVASDARQSFDVYAYEVLPVLFDTDGQQPLKMPHISVEPVPPDFDCLGYDVVVLNNMRSDKKQPPSYEFGCSPLTCNSLLKEVPVNDHCLLDSESDALDLARRVAQSDGRMGEPGPYVVVRVLRKRK